MAERDSYKERNLLKSGLLFGKSINANFAKNATVKKCYIDSRQLVDLLFTDGVIIRGRGKNFRSIFSDCVVSDMEVSYCSLIIHLDCSSINYKQYIP